MNPLPHGVQMGFTIRVAGNGSTSRGTGDKIEPGNELENMIDIENRDFRVYFYEKASDAYIGELEIISVLKVTDNNEYNNDYYVVGQVDNQFVTRLNNGFHMVVMANLRNWAVRNAADNCEMGYYPVEPSYNPDKDKFVQCYHYGLGAESNKETFDQNYDGNAGYIVSKDKLIPMWGCQTYDEDLTENTITQLGAPINMLRTLAKIEVNCNLEAMELSEVQTIESVVLTKSRSCVRIEQLLNPNNVQFDETQTDHEKPNIRDNTNRVNEPIYFTEQTETGSNKQKFVIYVPEMNDGTVNDNCQPSIQVTLGGKSITFPVSSAGTEATRIPLLRNHIYRYTITKITDKVEILYQGTEWHKVTNEDIIFGGNYEEPIGKVDESNN